MKAVIFPRTDGDVILDFRDKIVDGALVPCVVVVNATGAEVVNNLATLFQFRDGGGHIEVVRPVITTELGFERGEDEKVVC